MGKGTIISGGTNGNYIIQVNYNQSRYNNQINTLNNNINWCDDEIIKINNDTTLSLTEKEEKIKEINLQKTSFNLRKKTLENSFKEDYTVSAWCADLSEELSGEVGTIEIPGEVGDVMIKPGYINANWTSDDGQLMSTSSMNSAQAYYNLAIMPYWQKWKPTYRYATISNVTDTTATITLEPASSSQQNLNINKQTTFSNVEIDYMDCNGQAFTSGDQVLVQFLNNPDTPKIIGFKDNPKPCEMTYIGTWSEYVLVEGVYVKKYWVIDLKTELLVDLPNVGNPFIANDIWGHPTASPNEMATLLESELNLNSVYAPNYGLETRIESDPYSWDTDNYVNIPTGNYLLENEMTKIRSWEVIPGWGNTWSVDVYDINNIIRLSHHYVNFGNTLANTSVGFLGYVNTDTGDAYWREKGMVSVWTGSGTLSIEYTEVYWQLNTGTTPLVLQMSNMTKWSTMKTSVNYTEGTWTSGDIGHFIILK